MEESSRTLSESFRDARRNAIVWSAICVAWLGFSVQLEKIKELDFLVPPRIPLGLLLVWTYLAWRLTVELVSELTVLRSDSWRRYDTLLTMAIVWSAGVILFFDFCSGIDEMRKPGMPTEETGLFVFIFGVASSAGLLRAFRSTRETKWIRRILIGVESLTLGYALFLLSSVSLLWAFPIKHWGDVALLLVGSLWIVLTGVSYWAIKPMLQLIGFWLPPRAGAKTD